MIQVLPESVANQIAAGEVIQRPASVVKELVENAVDAGSTLVSVLVKDAGRTLIQIIDNGCGMSELDARLSFERHATSKIKTAEDLFAIQTFGFRGEALASVASIAEVELKTRRAEDELGTHITINASTVVGQEPTACPVGSVFTIKNLFYNVPARRKFLKSDAVELKHIITEIQRVAIGHPEVAFTLVSNGTEIYNLPKGNLRQRIVGLMGKSLSNQLIDVNVTTSMLRIRGFIGKPEQAKKGMGEQFFYVNNRFFKSTYFQKAVFNAYDQLIQQSTFPSYFLFFDIEPDKIDVNIHPTKVEIKFEEEQTIWQLLNAAVRESIGKFALAPTIDFNTEGAIDIPVAGTAAELSTPSVAIDYSYNPFEEEKKKVENNSFSPNVGRERAPQGWQSLYGGLNDSFVDAFEKAEKQNDEALFKHGEVNTERIFMQLKSTYVLTPVKSGLMVIDQHRAHKRILFERFVQGLEQYGEVSQTELFPQHVELSPADYSLLEPLLDDIQSLGFDIRSMGKSSVVVYALPADIDTRNAAEVVQQLVLAIHEDGTVSAAKHRERLAASLAKAAAIPVNHKLGYEEMSELVDQLFSCHQPNICPDGKPTLTTVTIDELAKRFLR